MREEIKIAGFGGQGVILAGMIIGKAASIFGDYEATMIQAFGPEARGSACSAQVIIDSVPIAYPYVKRVSILVALNQEVYERFESQLNDDGILIYESEMVTLPDDRRHTIREFAVPAARIAEELGRSIVQNVVMIGFFAAVTGFMSYDSTEAAVRDSIPKGSEELNLSALQRGYACGQEMVDVKPAEAKAPA